MEVGQLPPKKGVFLVETHRRLEICINLRHTLFGLGMTINSECLEGRMMITTSVTFHPSC